MAQFIIRSEQPTGEELAKAIYDPCSRRYDPSAVPLAVEHFGVTPHGRDNYLWWNRERGAATKFASRHEAQIAIDGCLRDFPASRSWKMTIEEA